MSIKMKTTMKSFAIYLSLLTVFVHGAKAQGGGTESNFSLGFGARAMGLGQAYTALAQDPTAVFWNPAGLEYIKQQSATFFHTTLFEDSHYDFAAYAYPTLDLGSFGIGIGRIGVSGIDGRDINGDQTKIFEYSEYQAFFSYAKTLPWYGITPGITIRWLRMGFTNIGNDSDAGIAADIGVMYRPDWIGNAFIQDWSFGLNIKNVFKPQLKAGIAVDEYPLTAKLGIMKTIRLGQGGAFNVLLDLDHSQKRDMKFRFGTEYDFSDMGRVRIGHNGAALTFGLGGKYDMFEIDYGYNAMEYSDVFSATHRISVTVNFGMTRNDMFQIAERERIENENRIKKEIREADKREFVATHLEAADKFFEDEKYLDAIVEYQQVIGTEPFHFRAGVMLDSANGLLQNQFDQRQSLAVQDALDKNKATTDSMFIQEHFQRGRNLLDQKQFVEAMIEFNISLERNPDNPILKNSIATTRRRMAQEVNSLVQKSRDEFQNQNYSEALRLLADARLLGGDNSQLQNEIETLASRIRVQENIQQGLLLYDVGNYAEALKILEEALQLDPNNNLVKQYYDRTKAETMTSQEEMDPETEKKFLSGVNTFLSGKYAEAIKIWEEILEEHPYNKRVLESINNAKERLQKGK
jgi:tetratricopeptide (TPR) repeat protein